MVARPSLHKRWFAIPQIIATIDTVKHLTLSTSMIKSSETKLPGSSYWHRCQQRTGFIVPLDGSKMATHFMHLVGSGDGYAHFSSQKFFQTSIMKPPTVQCNQFPVTARQRPQTWGHHGFTGCAPWNLQPAATCPSASGQNSGSYWQHSNSPCQAPAEPFVWLAVATALAWHHSPMPGYASDYGGTCKLFGVFATKWYHDLPIYDTFWDLGELPDGSSVPELTWAHRSSSSPQQLSAFPSPLGINSSNQWWWSNGKGLAMIVFSYLCSLLLILQQKLSARGLLYVGCPFNPISSRSLLWNPPAQPCKMFFGVFDAVAKTIRWWPFFRSHW